MTGETSPSRVSSASLQKASEAKSHGAPRCLSVKNHDMQMFPGASRPLGRSSVVQAGLIQILKCEKTRSRLRTSISQPHGATSQPQGNMSATGQHLSHMGSIAATEATSHPQKQHPSLRGNIPDTGTASHPQKQHPSLRGNIPPTRATSQSQGRIPTTRVTSQP